MVELVITGGLCKSLVGRDILKSWYGNLQKTIWTRHLARLFAETGLHTGTTGVAGYGGADVRGVRGLMLSTGGGLRLFASLSLFDAVSLVRWLAFAGRRLALSLLLPLA